MAHYIRCSSHGISWNHSSSRPSSSEGSLPPVTNLKRKKISFFPDYPHHKLSLTDTLLNGWQDLHRHYRQAEALPDYPIFCWAPGHGRCIAAVHLLPASCSIIPIKCYAASSQAAKWTFDYTHRWQRENILPKNYKKF